MLAANTNFQIGFFTTSALRTHAYELAHAIAIEHLERIVANDLALDVIRSKSTRVVAAQTNSGLRKVVGSKREELRMPRNSIGHERRTR